MIPLSRRRLPADTTDVALRQALRSISTESASASDVLDFFRNAVPGFALRLSETVSGFTQGVGSSSLNRVAWGMSHKTMTDKQVNQLVDDVFTKLPAYGFTTISMFVVPVPENFKGSLVGYMSFLTQEGVADIHHKTLELLDAYQAELTNFLTNKSASLSSLSTTHIYKQAQEATEENQDGHKAYFPQTTGKSRARLGEIIERMADLNEVHALLSKLEGQHSKAPITQIHDRSVRCSEILNQVSHVVQERSLDEPISKAVIKNIAAGAYHIARMVEMCSAHRYRQEQTLHAVKDMFVHINEKMR